MGGSRDANGAENLLNLCGTGVSRSAALIGESASGCHGWITNPPRGIPREHLEAAGWLVGRNSTTRPARRVPVWIRDGWVLLREDGIAEPLYVMPPLRHPTRPGDLRPYRPDQGGAPLIEDRAFVMGLVADIVDEHLSVEEAAGWLDTTSLASRLSTRTAEEILRSLTGKVQIVNDLRTATYGPGEGPLGEVEAVADLDAAELRDLLARP